MTQVKTLIDKWCETGSQRELARLLGVNEAKLSNYKSGFHAMPPERFLRLVDLVDAPEKESLVYAFVKARVEKIAEPFKLLLRLAKARQCWIGAFA